MINKKETPIGSFIHVLINNQYKAVCEVAETYDRSCQAKILRIADEAKEKGFAVGTKHIFNYENCSGLICYGKICQEINLRQIGFIESDEKTWKLMFYFGNMRLYWKYDKKKQYNTFKFKPDYTMKQWTKIECMYIHSLQNIVRFLTGGELEFTWQEKKNE